MGSVLTILLGRVCNYKILTLITTVKVSVVALHDGFQRCRESILQVKELDLSYFAWVLDLPKGVTLLVYGPQSRITATLSNLLLSNSRMALMNC